MCRAVISRGNKSVVKSHSALVSDCFGFLSLSVSLGFGVRLVVVVLSVLLVNRTRVSSAVR